MIDELGYLHPDPRGAELLFQVTTEREERASIAVATNAPFSQWAATFTDPRLCAPILDRLTFKADIIETGTDSYRLRTSRTVTNKKRKSDTNPTNSPTSHTHQVGAKSDERGGAKSS